MDSRRHTTTLLILLATVLSLGPIALEAIELKGSFSSEWYSYDQAGQQHLRPYQRLQTDLLAYRFASGKSLTWHNSLRWSSDLTNKLPGDPELSIYQSFVQYDGLPARTTVRLGRQFVYNGLGSALIDGLRFRGLEYHKFRSDLYVGSSVDRLDPQKIRSPSDWLLLGGQVSYRPNYQTDLALNWSIRKDQADLDDQRLGLTGRHQRGQVRGFARVAFDPGKGEFDELTGRVSLPSNDWHFAVEYSSRLPRVRRASIFSLIGTKHYQNVRLSIARSLTNYWRLTGSVRSNLGRDQKVLRTTLGLKSDRYSIVWTHQSGDLGLNDGLRVGIRGLSYKRWRLFFGAGLNSYLVQDLQGERLTAWFGRVGLSRSVGYGLELEAEAQIIRDAVSNYDNRLLLRVSKAFSLGSSDD